MGQVWYALDEKFLVCACGCVTRYPRSYRDKPLTCVLCQQSVSEVVEEVPPIDSFDGEEIKVKCDCGGGITGHENQSAQCLTCQATVLFPRFSCVARSAPSVRQTKNRIAQTAKQLRKGGGGGPSVTTASQSKKCVRCGRALTTRKKYCYVCKPHGL